MLTGAGVTSAGSWLVREPSRALAQCSCMVPMVGREPESVRVERRRAPREMRPVCFRYFTRLGHQEDDAHRQTGEEIDKKG